MAYMFCLGPCIVCGRMFSFNPELVPSVVVHGQREPVCKTCIKRANPLREKNGLAPIHVLPGAYDAEECA